MNEEIAGCFANRIEVRFRQGRYDWLHMRLRARGPHVRSGLSCRIWSGCGPFRDLIAWLEALAAGVRCCSFEWDGEGNHWTLGWRCDALYVARTFDDPSVALDVRASRTQVVNVFYTAFRRFVESASYDPIRYERVRLGEWYAREHGRGRTEEELRGYLLPMSAAQAEAALQAIRVDEKPYIDRRWDRWNTLRRREHLDLFFAILGQGGWGAPLRTLRSPRLEAGLLLAGAGQEAP